MPNGILERALLQKPHERPKTQQKHKIFPLNMQLMHDRARELRSKAFRVSLQNAEAKKKLDGQLRKVLMGAQLVGKIKPCPPYIYLAHPTALFMVSGCPEGT